jgi:signal transduction histidine kinase
MKATFENSIEDNGKGIGEAIKDKIFQQFFSTEPTGQETRLGQSLAFDIVTNGHCGSLTVFSIPRAETTFELQLSIFDTNR